MRLNSGAWAGTERTQAFGKCICWDDSRVVGMEEVGLALEWPLQGAQPCLSASSPGAWVLLPGGEKHLSFKLAFRPSRDLGPSLPPLCQCCCGAKSVS